MAGELEQLAYDLARDALTQQDKTLDELRARTGTLLAAASLVASFVGARAVDRRGFDWLNVLALLAFTLSALLSVYVLFPRGGIQRSLSGPTVYEDFVDSDIDLPEAHRRLAYWIQEAYSRNQRSVNRLFLAFQAACLTLAAEVGLFVIALEVH
jgi:hypothetical protein